MAVLTIQDVSRCSGLSEPFLASDDSGFITAAALPLDGGITEAFTVPD